MDKENVVVQEKNVKDYFEEIARTFDSYYREDADTKGIVGKVAHLVFRKPGLFKRFGATFDLLGNIENKKVLDVGCGSGIYSIEIARRGGYATGVDIAQEMVDLCKSNAEKAGVADKCDFVAQDLNEFCKGNKVYNSVIAIGLFDYIAPSKQKEVLELLLSVSDGSVVVAFPKKWVPGALVRKIWFMTKKLEIWYFTKKGIKNLIKGSDYKAEFVNCGPLWTVKFYKGQ